MQGKANQARLDCFFKAGPSKTSSSAEATKAKAALNNKTAAKKSATIKAKGK